ncbi:uncharacterized protein LOC105914471 [Setaria italica]|uniref:Uncharacterized protein n=1 Tax=Setaria italica TaxID=4555 RepID=K3XTL1_SETIT|nr:uncharacterized protein LOC105914471 [Setaria italica]
MAMRLRRRSAFHGSGQPQPNMDDHGTHSERVTKVAGNPCHAGGGGGAAAAVQQHTAVHTESFKEVDGDGYDPRRGHNNHALQQQAHLQ